MVEDSSSVGTSSGTVDSTPPKTIQVVHVIVLVHGWLGNSLEMDSLKESLQIAIENNEATISSNTEFVVHSAICNEGKTTDGIMAGGQRLAQEVNSLIRYIVDTHPDAKITLSICGNSLGGLYARQALADIEWNVTSTATDDTTSTPRIISPMLFVTTATPHLGVSQHTYIKLPRAFEYPIAKLLDQTGKDLFRYSTVLEDLTFQEKYLHPLQSFQRRLAYVNVYGTDFQVPTPTAAFWAMDSDSPHHVVDTKLIISGDVKDDADDTDDDSRIHPISWTPPNSIVMSLVTPQSPTSTKDTARSHRFQDWSQALDGLGWTKVLVDVREHIPQLSMMWARSSSSSLSSDNSNSGTVFSNKEDSNDDVSTSNDNQLQNTNHKKSVWTAHELLSEFGTGLLTIGGLASGKVRIPLGHTVMVANAKDKLNKWLTMGGKPVMNWLASSIIQTLLQRLAIPSVTPTTLELQVADDTETTVSKDETSLQ